MKKLFGIISVLALLNACSSGTVKLSGAGATFPAPYYSIAFKEYAAMSGTEVNYGAIGSGGGIRSLADRTVDFGATDVFLSDEEQKGMPDEVIHIPTAMGAVVLSYNISGIDELRLTAEVISAIYRGEILQWDDARIAAINPDKTLPAKQITPVYRSDGSGTTAVFSEYMSKADETWKEAIGSGKSLNFPAGIAGKGNPGVAGILAETEGSIGYIGSEYALALGLNAALLRNASGNFVAATERNISAAATADIPADTRISITDSSAPDAYPIATFTWLIAYKNQNYSNRTPEQYEALKGLFNFILSNKGQDIASRTFYAPLPANVREKADAIVKSMSY